ncbi:helix-turn-helix domain-containing protein [Georgenia sp. Z1491]|uniref:helix-turn-helix domain-containing protein n=1 Tax=Georgenia sp. Z1491 TaxID=3416707 RepID=UPI003CF008B6
MDRQTRADLALGSAIRARRHARGVTLVSLAGATGLSHSFLSQVERGHARPSMRSLFQIAQALGTTQQALMGAGRVDADEVLRGRDAPRVRAVRTGGSSRPDAGASGARLVLRAGDVDITEFVAPPQDFRDLFTHDHAESLYVAAGTVELELVDPDGTHRLVTLDARDTVSYGGGVPHRFRQVGAPTAVVLVVHAHDGGADAEHVSDPGSPDRR